VPTREDLVAKKAAGDRPGSDRPRRVRSVPSKRTVCLFRDEAGMLAWRSRDLEGEDIDRIKPAYAYAYAAHALRDLLMAPIADDPLGVAETIGRIERLDRERAALDATYRPAGKVPAVRYEIRLTPLE
jgi:hypothetical protein